MRFQFSILTILVCTAALAVATAACVSVPVRAEQLDVLPGRTYRMIDVELRPRLPDIAERMLWAGPLAIAVGVGGVWVGRHVTNFSPTVASRHRSGRTTAASGRGSRECSLMPKFNPSKIVCEKCGGPT